MFTITIETNFAACHQLTLADGSKEPSHSHDWQVTVEVSSEKLDQIGCVMDFHQLKSAADSIAAELDNDRLAGLEYFQKNNPSAENVAKYIFDGLKSILPDEVVLTSVEVTEHPGCRAKFCI